MINFKNIFAFVVVLILPSIPVILLYILFDNLNYFEVNDTARGIAATGPIAAYFVLLTVSWRIFKKLYPDINAINSKANKLIGKWEVISTSSGGSEYKGTADLAFEDFSLFLNGTFKYADRYVARYKTTLTRLNRNEFHLVYTLTDIRDPLKKQHFTGYCVLQIDYENMIMTGDWAELETNKFGSIEYKKI